MSEDYTIRQATVDDVDTIARQRLAMFHDMGVPDEAGLQAMDASFRVWLTEKFKIERYVGWFAVADDQVIAGAGLWINDWIPHPYDARTRRGYILNVYTEPAFRGRGIARRLVAGALDYCRQQQIHIVALHASDAGRPIYELLGFTASNEMRIRL